MTQESIAADPARPAAVYSVARERSAVVSCITTSSDSCSASCSACGSALRQRRPAGQHAGRGVATKSMPTTATSSPPSSATRCGDMDVMVMLAACADRGSGMDQGLTNRLSGSADLNPLLYGIRNPQSTETFQVASKERCSLPTSRNEHRYASCLCPCCGCAVVVPCRVLPASTHPANQQAPVLWPNGLDRVLQESNGAAPRFNRRARA